MSNNAKVAVGWVAFMLAVIFLTVGLPTIARENDWNGEQFETYCEYKYGGQVLDGYETACFKKIGDASYIRVATKDEFLREKNK